MVTISCGLTVDVRANPGTYATGIDGAGFIFSLTTWDFSGARLVVRWDQTSGDIFPIDTAPVTCTHIDAVDRDELAHIKLSAFAVSIGSKTIDQVFRDRWSDDSGRIAGMPVTGYRI